MSKAVLISIRPEWCQKIANGEKTIEVRKSRPKLDTPFKCYIYCTNTRPYLVWGDVFRGNWETEFTTIYGYNRKDAEKIWDIFNGHVIGEFTCKGTPAYWTSELKDLEELSAKSCVSVDNLHEYAGDCEWLIGWHISGLVIFDEPIPLSEFKGWQESILGPRYTPLTHPPQSWCYVSSLEK